MPFRHTFRIARFVLGFCAMLGGAASLGASPAAADNVLRIANAVEVDTLDPHVVSDTGRLPFKMNTYDGLYRWVGNPPELIPWLAESHTVSEDGLTYTFKLREGATFHDGTEVTADDVVYSIERILALGQGPARLFKPIVAPGSTKADGKYTVVFTLNQPAAPFVATVPELVVVNSKLVKEHEKDGDWGAEWLSQNGAASGPFQIVEWDRAVGWTAERYPEHFAGWGEKYLDAIRFRTIREPNTQSLMLMKGDLDFFVGTLSSDQLDRVGKADNVEIVREKGMRLFMLDINNQRPPFNNVHLRRAISYAFDYDAFINGALGGKVARNVAPIPANMWGYPADIEGYHYDLDKAQEELEKSGVTFSEPVKIHSMTGISQTEQAAIIMQAGLRKIGITAEVVSETWPTLANKAKGWETTPDIWTVWSGAQYVDPHNWTGDQYNSANWGSWKTGTYYKNPKVDEMMAKAYVSSDKAERTRLYEEANRQIVEDAAAVYIYNQDWFGAKSTRMKGYQYTPVGNGNDLRTVYIEE